MLSRTGERQRQRRQHRARDKRHWRNRPAELLGDHGRVEQRHRQAAVRCRDHHPGDADAGERMRHRLADRGTRLGASTHVIERRGFREAPRDRIAQHVLLG